MNTVLIFISFLYTVNAQRGFYSGARPQGYYDQPQLESTINNRFGGSDSSSAINTPTGQLPVNANGDVYLVNYLASLPRDKQPFWFINYQQLEAQRGGGAQQQPALSQSAQAQPALSQPLNNNQGQTNVVNRFEESRPVSQVSSYQSIGPFKLVVGIPPSSNQL